MLERLYNLIICLVLYWTFNVCELKADFGSQVIEPAINFIAQQAKQVVRNNNNNNGQPNMVYCYNNGNGTNNPYFTPQPSQITYFVNSNQGNPNFVPLNQGLSGTNLVKVVAISPDGSKIARVTRSNNQELVTIRTNQNFEKTILNVMNPESIEGVYLAGSRYLVCAIKNLNNNLWHLRVVDLQQNLSQGRISYRNLTPINNATYIGVVTPRTSNSEMICTTSFNGATYVTQKINLGNGNILYSIEGNQAPLVDKNLDVRIFYNLSTNVLGTSTSYDAFLVAPSQNNVITSNKLIENIADIDRTRYIGVVGNMCYKIEMLGDNSLVMRGINLNGNVISDYGTINGVSSLLDCAVNLDMQGNPCFITIGSGDNARNFALTTDFQKDVEVLNSEFNGIGWSRIGYTGDSKVWVLCVYTQPANRFFIYDTRNNGISEVTDKGLQATKFLNKQQAVFNQQQMIMNNGVVFGSAVQQGGQQPQMMRIM